MADTPDQVEGGLSAASIPVNPPNIKGGMSVKGMIALDPTQTSEILANMQQMIDQRAGAQNMIFGGPNYNTMLSALKDASAWGSGGVQGPTQALAVRDEQKAKEAKELFDMRTQMASYKAAQAQQEAFNKRRQAELGGLTPGIAGGAGGFGSMPAEIRQALSNARTEDEYNKIYNDYAATVAKAKTGFEYNPQAFKRDIEISLPNGRYELVDAITAQKLASLGLASIPEFTQAGKPNTPTAAPAAPAAGGENVPVSVRNNNPGNIVDPKTGQFKVFNTKEEGDKALEEDLKLKLTGQSDAYKTKFGTTPITPAKLAETWSPAAGKGNTPESTANYGKFIAKNLGIDANQPIEYTPENLAKIKTAITQFEAGSYTPSRPAIAGGTPTQPAPSAQVAGGPRATLPEMKSQQASTEAGLTEELKKKGATLATHEAAVIEARKTANARLESANYVNNILDKHPMAFGILTKPTVAAGIAAALEKGINAGPSGTIGFEGIEPLIRQSMKGMKQEDIDAVQKVAREFAQMQLQEAKIVLAGQGAVSDAERNLVRDMTGSIKNSPAALRDILKWGTMRAEYDRQIGDAYKEFRKTAPNASYQQFMLSDRYENLTDAYDSRIREFARKGGTSAAPAEGGTKPVTSGTTAGGLKWRVVTQ